MRRSGHGAAAALSAAPSISRDARAARPGRACTASLTDHLARQAERRRVDRYVLLDAQDWMTDEQLTALWREITRTAGRGARVIFRTAADDASLPGRVPTRSCRPLAVRGARSAELHKRDRSAIYGGFHLYVLRERAA